jgi:competence protein ComEC
MPLKKSWPVLRLALVVAALLTLSTCASTGDARRDDDDDRRDDVGDGDGVRSADGNTNDDEDEDAPPGAGVPARDPSFRPESTLSVHLLDVGQGAATLLEFPCAAVLIDTGGELNEDFDARVALKSQLETFFARRTDLNRRLALLVISHPHIDHLRGIKSLFETVTVERIIDNGHSGDELVAAEIGLMRRKIADEGIAYRAINNRDLKRGGIIDDVVDPVACPAVDPKIRALWGGVESDPGWGTDNYGHTRFENENNHSVVLRVDFGATSLLFPGDLEDVAIMSLIERYEGTRWLDVDVYQAGHHGSANGTTKGLMEAMTPSIALLAMGDPARQHPWTAWAYGHPRASTVELLVRGVEQHRPAVDVLVGKGTKRFDNRRIDAAVFGTGWDGAVVVDVDVDGRMSVRRAFGRR